MRFRSRDIRTADLEQCARLLMARPPFREWFPSLEIPDLANILARLLSRAAITGRVVEASALPSGQEIVTFGISAFVEEAWLAEYLRNPFPFPGADFIRRALKGENLSLLEDDEVATHNATDGLHSMTIALGWALEVVPQEHTITYLQTSIQAFHDAHHGYRLAEIVSECLAGPESDFFLSGAAWRVRSRYGLLEPPGAGCVPGTPVLIGLTRAEAQTIQHAGAATADLFVWREPRYAFTPEQQQFLLLAMDHTSDAELSRVLKLKPDALRRRWTRIFKRVEKLQPVDDPVLPHATDLTGKRTRLLARLAKEMYELRLHIPPDC